jgi:acyl carrier protein
LKRTESDIRDWCLNYFSTTLEIPAAQIDPQTRFSHLGMDSASMLTFLVGLEEWLDIELDPDTALEHQTVAQLVKYVVTLGKSS